MISGTIDLCRELLLSDPIVHVLQKFRSDRRANPNIVLNKLFFSHSSAFLDFLRMAIRV